MAATGNQADHSTVEGALSNAVEGDTIVLSPGRYEEVISISVPDITIRSERKHKATLCARPDEHEWSVVTIEASNVTISGLVIEGASDAEGDVPATVLVEAPEVNVLCCKINGKSSIGVKTFAVNTNVTDCVIAVGRTAILAMESSCVQVEDCKLESSHDTGIWLRGASNSRIIDTAVKKCGHTGIWLDSAPTQLKNVMVSASHHDGIVCDWPESTPITDTEYNSLSLQGHLLDNVKITGNKDNGLYVKPGVRVVCTDCEFSRNGDAGAFFEGPEDDNQAKQESREERAAKCAISIIQDTVVHRNNGHGVECEEDGLLQLKSRNDFDRNKKGDCFRTAGPTKRSRVSSEDDSVDEETTANTQSSSDNRGQDIDGSFVGPIAKITSKASVQLPKNWPSYLIFIGNNNVNSFPSMDKLQEWYFTNKVTVNKNVGIRPSPGRGLGLYASKKLNKGQVVGYYSGHLRKQQVKHDSEYVAKWRPKGKDEDDEWEIDAEWGGNEMRFANYCNEDEEPNMEADCCTRNGLQVISLKTTMSVQKGAELVWDYGEDYEVEDEDEEE